MEFQFEQRYRAVESRDSRFDGYFFTAVTTTGIYCRPSCPSITPKPSNINFYPSAAAAQSAGFRACKRCRPDASPGSPEWNVRSDLVGRAMRLIADGVVDREGIPGLARQLALSERHVHRLLMADLGAGPLALARSQRTQTARILLESTDLPMTQVAFAAGFESVRQFNDTVREVFASTPSELRARNYQSQAAVGTGISLRLSYRTPFLAESLFRFLAARAVPTVESGGPAQYARALRLPHGFGTVSLAGEPGFIRGVLVLDDLRDLSLVVHRCRRLLDLDADATVIDQALAADAYLQPLVAANPGRRVPGHVDGAELAIRAVLGQQVSVAGARTLAARIVARFGTPLRAPSNGITHSFPGPADLAEADLSQIGLTVARQRTIRALAQALATDSICLDPGADRADARARLLALPGIGPWTAEYVAMRALGDPDAFMPTDLGVIRAAARLGLPTQQRALEHHAERWRPWRSYAIQHLWGQPVPATQIP